MKKSTMLIIFIVYLASIIIIGFFGMSVKVYDEIKYVKSIEMSVEAENEEMFDFTYYGLDSVGNKIYDLSVNFDNALTGEFVRKSGIREQRKYVPLNLIPYVTYDTGDVANTEEESIVYSINNETLVAKESVSLSDAGALICFKKDSAFYIYVNPATKSGNGTSVTIRVYVI